MNIGMLGLMQTNVQPEINEQSSTNASKSGFASLFASLIPNDEQQVAADAQITLSISKQAFEMVNNLIAILHADDVETLEGSQQLIGEVKLSESIEDLFQIIMHYLGINEEDWNAMLEKTTDSIVLGESKTDFPDERVDNEETGDQLQGLLQVLSQVHRLMPDQLVHAVNHDVANIVKVGKLFDLLLAHQDMYVGTTNKQREMLENDLKNLKDKLEALLKSTKQSGRHEFLQRTFATFKNESISLHLAQPVSEAGQMNPMNVEIPKLEGVVQQLFPFQQISKAEQLTLMVENNGKPATPEQLIKQFNSILSKSQFLKEGGTQRLFIKLYPEHLGAMRIELIQKNETMIARILTTTAMAREMLDSQLHSLKQAFANQNILVERIEVSQQLSQQDRFLQKDNEAGQQHKQQNDQHKNEQEEQETFSDTFEDVLLNVEV